MVCRKDGMPTHTYDMDATYTFQGQMHRWTWKETFGFKTAKSPDQQDELVQFQNGTQDRSRGIKLKKKHQSEFRKKLAR